MTNLAIIYPYYTNVDLLMMQLDVWSGYTPHVKRGLTIILVDDCSPDKVSAQSVIHRWENERAKTVDWNLRLLYIEQDFLWNTAGARNLGSYYVKRQNRHAVIVMSLMDVFTPNSTMCNLIKLIDTGHFLDQKSVCKFSRLVVPGLIPVGPHQSSLFACHVETFWSVGGFDEDFTGGYGHDDTLLYMLFCITGKRVDEPDIGTVLQYCREGESAAGVGKNFELSEIVYEYNFTDETQGRHINWSRNAKLFSRKVSKWREVLRSKKVNELSTEELAIGEQMVQHNLNQMNCRFNWHVAARWVDKHRVRDYPLRDYPKDYYMQTYTPAEQKILGLIS